MPARRERPGLRLAVADDAGDDQVGVVERRAERVRERVAELAALVDRARRLGRDVRGDAARERELAEERAEPVVVLADVRVDLAVGAFEVRVRDEPGPAVARAGDVDHREVARLDRAVQVRVDEVQAGRRAEVPEQPRLDVLRLAAARAAAGCRAGRSARRRGSSPRASTRRAARAPLARAARWSPASPCRRRRGRSAPRTR